MPAPEVTLQAGVPRTFPYTGQAIPLLHLLAPCAGKVASVSYRAPNGSRVVWTPGNTGGEMLWVLPNSEVSVLVTETCTLRW